MSRLGLAVLASAILLGAGCSDEETAPMQETQTSSASLVTDSGTDTAADTDATSTGSQTTDPDSATTGAPGESTGGATDGDQATPPIKFDGGVPDAPDTVFCGAPHPVTCDANSDDVWNAIGLNCPGGPEVDGSTMGDPQQFHVHTGNIGTHMPAPFPPREGEKILIMSSGVASDLLVAGLFASTNVQNTFPGQNLPPPIQTNMVSNTEDCTDNPGLVGTGDCSNTIEGQWSQGNGAFDYAEMRFNVEVPAATFGFSYDLAMFSTEYPTWYQTQYNDMYVAWLESEQWTGNISFDEAGNPISLNAGFLDYKDAPNNFDCPAPCEAPELAGTAMEGHAGTKWLTTTAPVTPGEQIEVVLAVFDLSDGILDTVVLVDNFLWTCEGGPPITIPG